MNRAPSSDPDPHQSSVIQLIKNEVPHCGVVLLFVLFVGFYPKERQMALCNHNVPDRFICPDCLAIRRVKASLPAHLRFERVEHGSDHRSGSVPRDPVQRLRFRDGSGVRRVRTERAVP